MSSPLSIEKYSEKCIVVRGETKTYLNELKELGGKWNAGLKGGGGWIFPATKLDKVTILVNRAKNNPKENIKETSKVQEPSKNQEKEYITRKEFLSLVSEVERLKTIIENMTNIKINKVKTEDSKKVEEDINSDESINTEKRMVKKK